jgi:NADH dehydrogenase
LLHEVAVEMVAMHHVVHPVRQALRGTGVRFTEAAVRGIDLATRTVTTEHGTVGYDYLVLGLGSETNYFGIEGAARHSFPLKSLGEAYRLRNHLISMFEAASRTTDPEQRRALLTIVQAGAGFTGVEAITEIHDMIAEALLRDYPSIRHDDVRLLLVDALDDLPCPMDRGLAARTRSLIEHKGIELHLNTRITGAGPGWVALDGTRVPTHTLIWAAGVCASPLVAGLPVAHGSGGRAVVHPTLQLPEYPEVLALGDCACCLDGDGPPLPTTAQVANQQAPVGADNLVRLLRGEAPAPFRYRRMGELASLGAYRAVAQLGPLKLHGFLAWWVWRTIYLMKMPQWGDRVRIAADWTLDFFFSRDTSRVEIADCPGCTLPDCAHREDDRREPAAE